VNAVYGFETLVEFTMKVELIRKPASQLAGYNLLIIPHEQ
jgi:hypothetical protein